MRIISGKGKRKPNVSCVAAPKTSAAAAVVLCLCLHICWPYRLGFWKLPLLFPAAGAVAAGTVVVAVVVCGGGR